MYSCVLQIMLPLNYIFYQLLVAVLFLILAQFQYLEHFAVQRKQMLVPLQVKYMDTIKRVRAVDDQLRELASNYVEHEFVHPDAPSSIRNATIIGRTGPTMKTVKELARATELSINVRKPCGGDKHGQGLTLVVLVYNRVEDYARREVIRNTFGSSLKRNAKSEIYFIVARHSDPKMELLIRQEALKYNDVIQVDYPENYYNCTVKGIALVRWAALHCPFAKFVFKFDDDSFIRVNPLLTYLDTVERSHIMGLLSVFDEAVHSNSSKWYINEKYYPYMFYPSFIRGAYLIPGHFTTPIYEALVSEPQSVTIPALPFDDVYITGILAAKAMLPRAYAENFIHMSARVIETQAYKDYSVHFNTLSIDKMNQFWNLFHED